ncbi:DUF2868 domain-containing protein [Oligoflexus tunisiensis]|uniref:DUF2868 domain-containing protein n=1 Tax=Oligoflexus tunisiensis TaxID=708132 RepID=UPI00114CFB3E|nr:DUF2868 domain-containing protein [Oligoflexus tunisiensis]
MAGQPERSFTLADLIDYELQLALDSRARPEDLAQRDKGLQLDAAVLRQGKAAALKTWLVKMRGPYGERFLQLRQLVNLGLVTVGALLGWGTVRGLLTYDGHHPVNVLPFLSLFVLVPLLFLLVLFAKGLLAQLFGKLPGGWVTSSSLWILSRVMKKNQADLPVLDVWHRLKALHPRVFAWQAWILSQSFALAFYLTALISFLFYVTVHDYAFAWQTTLRLGPDALGNLVRGVAWPFAWLGPPLVPDQALIQATQYDRFAARYLSSAGQQLAADWWPFLAMLMVSYGVLPRLLLLIYFKVRLNRHLHRMAFDDFASEEVWLRLQGHGLGWEAAPGTKELVAPAEAEPLRARKDQPLMVVRWRQAPFPDDQLRSYFEERGYVVQSIRNAEGRDSELQGILEALKEGQALALVCDPWELPGEAFNRLRLAVRERLPTRTPIFLVPLQQGNEAGGIHVAREDRPLWEASLKTFRDPYIGLLHEGKGAP